MWGVDQTQINDLKKQVNTQYYGNTKLVSSLKLVTKKSEDIINFKPEYVVIAVPSIHISSTLEMFANKFEAGYEIIKKWYKKETSNALEWKELKPIFIETGGYYYAQSVVGYRYNRARFYPYTKAYLETANYLKWYCKNKTGAERANCMNRLFLPMCY